MDPSYVHIWYLINGGSGLNLVDGTIENRHFLDSRGCSAGRSSYGRGFFNFVFLFFAFDIFGLLFPFAVPAEHPRIRMTFKSQPRVYNAVLEKKCLRLCT